MHNFYFASLSCPLSYIFILQLCRWAISSNTPMSLFLLGQPELRRILQMQIYEAITQRVNLRFHLSGME